MHIIMYWLIVSKINPPIFLATVPDNLIFTTFCVYELSLYFLTLNERILVIFFLFCYYVSLYLGQILISEYRLP